MRQSKMLIRYADGVLMTHNDQQVPFGVSQG
jgi:hypothetical protein